LPSRPRSTRSPRLPSRAAGMAFRTSRTRPGDPYTGPGSGDPPRRCIGTFLPKSSNRRRSRRPQPPVACIRRASPTVRATGPSPRKPRRGTARSSRCRSRHRCSAAQAAVLHGQRQAAGPGGIQLRNHVPRLFAERWVVRRRHTRFPTPRSDVLGVRRAIPFCSLPGPRGFLRR
jgi:hypothetical protein